MLRSKGETLFQTDTYWGSAQPYRGHISARRAEWPWPYGTNFAERSPFESEILCLSELVSHQEGVGGLDRYRRGTPLSLSTRVHSHPI